MSPLQISRATCNRSAQGTPTAAPPSLPHPFCHLLNIPPPPSASLPYPIPSPSPNPLHSPLHHHNRHHISPLPLFRVFSPACDSDCMHVHLRFFPFPSAAPQPLFSHSFILVTRAAPSFLVIPFSPLSLSLSLSLSPSAHPFLPPHFVNDIQPQSRRIKKPS